MDSACFLFPRNIKLTFVFYTVRKIKIDKRLIGNAGAYRHFLEVVYYAAVDIYCYLLL